MADFHALKAPGTLAPGAFLALPGTVTVDGCEPDLDALLPAADAARYARRYGPDGKPNVKVIVNWRNRGYLPVATRDDGTEIRDSRGRPYYRLRDVARADALTSQRGQQMARRLLERAAPAA